MLNPYVLLTVGVLWALSCTFAYVKGQTHAENAAKAAYADALDDTIANARESAKIDVRLAVEAEQKRQKARVEFKDRIVTVTREINAKTLPAECRISDDGVRLFNDLIRSTNDTATDSKPKPMPPVAPSDGRKPILHSAGVSGDD